MTEQHPVVAWLDGAIVPMDQCVVHARSQGAFWGANAFEGLRAYWREGDAAYTIFRLADHLDRLRLSRRMLHLPCQYGDEDITRAVSELLALNDLRTDAHVCVVAYFGIGPNYDSLGHTDDCGMHITVIPAPRSERYDRGVHVCVSSWRRIGDESMPPRIKTGANYHNGRLAHHEAVRNGFDTALLLNQHGAVAESPNSCLVMLRGERLVTPPGTAGVLEGITLDTLGVLASAELGVDLEHREIDRTELYVADELMLCGTLAEIQPIVAIDRLPVGDGRPGPVTRELQALYEREVQFSVRAGWTTRVALGGSPSVGVPA